MSNVLVMVIGWTDVGSGGCILVSCADSNTSFEVEVVKSTTYELPKVQLEHIFAAKGL